MYIYSTKLFSKTHCIFDQDNSSYAPRGLNRHIKTEPYWFIDRQTAILLLLRKGCSSVALYCNTTPKIPFNKDDNIHKSEALLSEGSLSE